MHPVTRRRAITRNGVAAGSVWETRMKLDEVRGGIKVFNDSGGDGHDDEQGLRVYGKLRQNQRDGAEKRQRKSWKQPEPPGSPIQPRKAKSTEIGCKSGVEDEGVLITCDGQRIREEMENEVVEIQVEEHRGFEFDDKEMDPPVEKELKMEETKKVEEEHKMDVMMHPAPQQPAMADVEKKKKKNKSDFKVKDPDPEPQIQGQGEGEEEEIHFDIDSGTSNRMQHIVDLVMWRDIPRTSFAFGFGSFFLLSSSYAKEIINLSLITVISYMGLAYLAAVFLMRLFLRRGEEAGFRESCLIREEEAILILRRILPYLNEVILRTRSLFSGDPATTMKLAVILFVMARCGSSITIWTLAKLLFFGVFTVPKVLSSYSVLLSRYSQFWLARLRDSWDSCSHKKAVAAAVFTLIWNLSSTVARIWAVFMLIIAMRLYQQSMMMPLDEGELRIEHHHVQPHKQQKQQNIANSPCINSRPRRGPISLVKVEKVKKMAI